MEQIAPGIWKLNVDSNVYVFEKEHIVIDAGPPEYREVVGREIAKVTDPSAIKKVIFTHLHYDHIGNFSLFPNAKFYASPEEIAYYEKDTVGAILHPQMAKQFNVALQPLKSLDGFDIIRCPGHSHGSIALFYRKEKILFSGDTLFNNGIGRTDFPCSLPEKMDESLLKLGKIKYRILAPGHDY